MTVNLPATHGAPVTGIWKVGCIRYLVTLAERHGVGPELAELAATVLPGTPLAEPERLRSAGARAWRWAPEMREIADACDEVSLPDELPRAAETLLERWRQYKDDPDVPLDELLRAL